MLNTNDEQLIFTKKIILKSLRAKTIIRILKIIFNNELQRRQNGNKFILTAGPSISQKEVSYVNDAVSKGWNNNANDYLKKLEKNFADI